MPDLERLTDQLRVDLADTPEKKAWARGFNEGKSYARKEIAWIVIFCVTLVVSLFLYHM